MTLLVALGGCLTTNESVELSSTAGITYEEFKARAHVEPWEGGGYIIDGDVPVENEQELYEIWSSLSQGALAIKTSAGADVVWSATQKLALTYCISNDFDDLKPQVVTAMAAATGAWEAAANIKYTYVSAQDATCSDANTNVLFDVSPYPPDSMPPLARAFFPDDARVRRNVLIDSSAFDAGKWSLAGILRHELGHTLGFRHEHIRPEANSTCTETPDYRGITSYDSNSVMHYPQCNGTNTGDLVLTASDKAGAAMVYGAPGANPPPSNPPPTMPTAPVPTGNNPVPPPTKRDDGGGCQAGGHLGWGSLGLLALFARRRRRRA